MDLNSLDYLGRWLSLLARSGKSLEELGRWLGTHPKSTPAAPSFPPNPLFPFSLQGSHDRQDSSIPSPDALPAPEYFKKTFNDFLKCCGMVAPAEHAELLRKYEKLKQKSQEQEETIANLKFLLTQNTGTAGQGVQLFETLLEQQTQQFNQFMKGLRRFQEPSP